MPESFAAGLDAQSRTRMVDTLNRLLADGLALQMATKGAHWNIKGPGFIGVHELLDTVATHLRDSTDEIAERAVTLGGLARGTLEAVQDQTQVQPYPTDAVEIRDHLQALVDRFEGVGARLRQGIQDAEDANDSDTADLLTAVSTQLDKDTWLIGANLPPRGD